MQVLKPIGISVACALVMWAQLWRPGPQVTTFPSDVDDTDQPYALYVPRDFDPAKTYPLVISLHGAYSNHRLNLRRVFGKGNRPNETDAEATRSFPAFRDVPYLVASPYARGTMGYQGIAEKDVYDVLADMKRRFHVDADRIYLTGLSMGGGGALWLGLTRPDIWAAIAPVCPAPPPGTAALAGNALNLPVHLFQGGADPVVPARDTRAWDRDLRELGTSVAYTEYPNVLHNSWDFAYKDAAIFDWFASFHRNRFPQRVRFTTSHYKYASAYWVMIDRLTPGTFASLDARFTGTSRVSVETGNLDAFTLNVNGHPAYRPGVPLQVSIDGQRLRPGSQLSFHRGANGWVPGRLIPAGDSKRPGLEGPIGEALAGRQSYIYGRDDDAGREAAGRLTDWSTPRTPLLLSLRAFSDQEAPAAGTLFLSGTAETNRLIARWRDQFPLSLEPSAADYGLLFVAPVDGRYVVVNSGVPWTTDLAYVKRPGLPFLAPIPRDLSSLGDFVLYRGSLDHVVAEGFFTPEWKVSAADQERLRATGVVRIR